MYEMRRKSSRNLAKSSPDKVQQTETPVRKSRRTVKRRRRSSSSDTGNSEEEQEVKTIERVSAEEGSFKNDASITDETDNIKDMQLKFTASCDSTSSPKRQSKDRQRKAGNAQEEKLPNQEVVPTRRSRRRGSPKVEESTRQEDEEDKKGKGKSKGKNKSKIEKIHPLNESEAHNEREISENVQVTPESPQTNTDNPVDNEHMTVENVENSEDGTKGEFDSVQAEEETKTNKEKTRAHHSLSKDINNAFDNKAKDKIPIKLDKNLDASENSSEHPSEHQNQCNKNTNQSPEKEAEINILTDNVDQKCIGSWEEKDENIQVIQTNEINEETIQEEIIVSSTEELKDDEAIIHQVNRNVQHGLVEEEKEKEEQEDMGNQIESEKEEKEYGKESLEIMKEEQEVEKEEQEIEKEEQEIEKEEQEIEKEEEIEKEQESVKDQESIREEPETEKEQQIVKEDKVQRKDPDPEKETGNSVFTTEESVIKNQPENKIETKTKSHKKKVEISRNFDEETRQTIIHRKRWGNAPVGLDLISPHLIPVDLDVIVSFCQNFHFLEETEVKLEHAETKDRRRSLAEHREKKTERKVSLDDLVRPMYGSQLSDNSIKSEDNMEAEIDNSNIIAMNRKISIVDDSASKLKPPPSPARNPVSEVLYITNLVRPFTLKQLKELLERTGKIIENGFWTDRIKSKCYVQYETAEEAEATRNALHGVHWPIGNGKKLIIDYATPTDLENSRNPPPPPPPPPAPSVPDVNKNEKENKEEQKKVKQEEEQITKEHDREREKERHRSEHVREWDVGKENMHRRHSRSHERHEKRRHSHRSPSPIDDFIARKHKKMEEQLPQKLMDDLFQKTKATPSIYWQPLTPEEIATKQQQRLQRMAEHKRQMEETSRSRADYGRGGPYRRRYD